MIIYIFYILFGAVLLYFGADFIVRGSSNIALKMKIKPLIIGLTIVAFGTSAPEFVVSVKAALINNADLAVGNVIVSNIFNTLFILRIEALLRPLKPHINPVIIQNITNLDFGTLLVSAVLVFPLKKSGFTLTKPEGGLLLVIYIIYITVLVTNTI